MDISAQVSLYPLGGGDLSPTIDQVLRIFRQHDLEVTPGSMSTLIFGDDEAMFSALLAALRRAVAQGRVVMVVTYANACPLPESYGIGQGNP
jgi:uncharacterized protein YqgV (UPF0045/DUF77 family)